MGPILVTSLKAGILITFAVLILCPFASAKPTGGENVVALVNGVPIMASDLSCAVEASLARKFFFQHGTIDDNPGTINLLIDIELLYQESLKNRFPGLVEDAEKKFRHEVSRAGGEERLRSTLMCNSISPEQFRKSIFRNLAINRLLNREVYSRITVSEDEIREYYDGNRHMYKKPESVRLRQIFIRFPPSADENTRHMVENRAHAVFRQAADGDDFVTLARKYSDAPAGASMGGEMGVIFKGNLHKTFETLVFNLSAGSITEPIRSQNGYHIFQVVSLSPATVMPLDEVRSRVITRIRRSKARAMISDYIQKLREKADIRILRDTPER